MNTPTNAPTVTYEANLNADGILIYRSIYAGVCGPAQESTLPSTIEDADAWIIDQGYVRTGNWATHASYNGLLLSAPVTPTN